jgi:hypothetical protein
MLRWFARGSLGFALILGFICLAATLQVRSAIAGGALANPAYGCMAARDIETLRAGPNQRLADWWISRQTYEYHLGEHRSAGLGLRGALAELGTRLALTKRERVELAYRSMKALPACKPVSGQPSHTDSVAIPHDR